MADLVTQVLTPSVSAPTFAATSASDTAEVGNGHNTVAVYKNGSAVSVDVTVVTPGTLGTGAAYPDKVYTVAAGDEVWIALIRDYLDPETPGRCTITVSPADPTVTAAVVRL
jgi:hypothetical protein